MSAHGEIPRDLASEGLSAGQELQGTGDLGTLGMTKVQQTTLREGKEAHDETVNKPECEGFVRLVAGSHGGSFVVLHKMGSTDGLVALESTLQGLDGRVGVGADEAEDLVQADSDVLDTV